MDQTEDINQLIRELNEDRPPSEGSSDSARLNRWLEGSSSAPEATSCSWPAPLPRSAWTGR